MKEQMKRMKSKVEDLLFEVELMQCSLEEQEELDWEFFDRLGTTFPQLNELWGVLSDRTWED